MHTAAYWQHRQRQVEAILAVQNVDTAYSFLVTLVTWVGP